MTRGMVVAALIACNLALIVLAVAIYRLSDGQVQ